MKLQRPADLFSKEVAGELVFKNCQDSIMGDPLKPLNMILLPLKTLPLHTLIMLNSTPLGQLVQDFGD